MDTSSQEISAINHGFPILGILKTFAFLIGLTPNLWPKLDPKMFAELFVNGVLNAKVSRDLYKYVSLELKKLCCSECVENKFPSKREKNIHCSSVHKQQLIICILCDYPCISFEEAKKSCRWMHSDNRLFVQLTRLSEDVVKLYTPPKPQKKKKTNTNKLKKNTTKRELIYPYKCSYCPRRFQMGFQLKEHTCSNYVPPITKKTIWKAKQEHFANNASKIVDAPTPNLS